MAEADRASTETRQFRVMRVAVGAANPLIRRLLDSRLAGPVGKNLLLLRYRGRTSGRTIATPVGYVRDGDRIVIITSPTYRWWHNFVGGAEAELRLPEGWRRGRAEIVMPDDPRYDEVVALHVAKRGPEMLNGFGLAVDAQGRLSPAAKATATDKAHLVFVALAPAGKS